MAFIPDMVEGAVDAIIDHLRTSFNANLDLVGELWASRDRPLNLPRVPPSQYHIAEAIDPLLLPAIFVVADRSPHDLRAQQWLKQDHKLLLGVLVESTGGAEDIQRVVWRYAQALLITLHDQNLGTTKATRTQITEIVYGPTIFRVTGGQRTYRKDITVRLDATQREDFEHA